MKRFNVLDSFAIKIIAMITMAFDHIGVIYGALWNQGMASPFYVTCRYIGRIAMPLYCFMLVEGVLHTRSYKKYAGKLSLMALLITGFLMFCYFGPVQELYGISSQGNIFLDLLLGSLMIYVLNHKNNYVKLIAIIPIAISILSFTAKCVEQANSCQGCAYTFNVLWYPKFLRLQYDWLSLALMLCFYFAYKGAKLFYKIREEAYGIPADTVEGTNEYRIATNIIGLILSMIPTAGYYMIKYFAPIIVWWAPNIQIFAIAASVILLFYSGQRGYNKKWFNIFSYLYYPVHILLIYGICYLIYLV